MTPAQARANRREMDMTQNQRDRLFAKRVRVVTKKKPKASASSEEAKP